MTVKETTTAEFDQEIKTGLVLVDFHAEWCGPCKMLGPILGEISGEVEGKAKIIKVNVDEAADIAKKFGISSIPTVILFKDGQKLDQFVGLKTKEDILEFINSHS